MIKVINRKGYVGKCVMIDRNSVLGNPFRFGGDTDVLRSEAIEKYAEYFLLKMSTDTNFRKEVARIYRAHRAGKTVMLGCWCKPLRCHGDVIKKFCLAVEAMEKILKLNMDDLFIS